MLALPWPRLYAPVPLKVEEWCLHRTYRQQEGRKKRSTCDCTRPIKLAILTSKFPTYTLRVPMPVTQSATLVSSLSAKKVPSHRWEGSQMGGGGEGKALM